MGLLSALKWLFTMEYGASEPKPAQSAELPPEMAELKRQLNERFANPMQELFDALGEGHRAQRHARAEALLALIADAELFIAKNPKGRITHLADVKREAADTWAKTVPLHTTNREDTFFVCILDTETTGVGQDDEPISVAALLVEVSHKLGEHIREIDRYVGYREPSVPIHPKARQVHGLSEADVAGKSFNMARLHQIMDSAEVIVAHNADFDYRMMSKVMPSVVNMQWGCSINDLRWAWSDITGGKTKLDYICSVLGVEKAKTHDAMGDVEALYKVLQTRTGKTNRSRTLLHPLIKKALKEQSDDY